MKASSSKSDSFEIAIDDGSKVIDQPSTCIEAEPFALQVIDKSMAPEFDLGCVIIIDPGERIKDGAFVLAEIDGEYIFRQLICDDAGAASRLVALDPDWPDIDIKDRPSCLRGVIVQRTGRRRRGHKRYD
ncbi:LexA family protein [Thioalkalivibrio sp. HK1]|uniref:LexA family protein n=1 Tax=Thioalkalivibrio sp. HK1 TaxID=1469245 RepID=UPI0004708F63|nr:S24 family peptidase [Thioalkalivibrio sp. HK1]